MSSKKITKLQPNGITEKLPKKVDNNKEPKSSNPAKPKKLENSQKEEKPKKVYKGEKVTKSKQLGTSESVMRHSEIQKPMNVNKELPESILKKPSVKPLTQKPVSQKPLRPRIIGRYYLDRLFYSHLDFKYYKDQLRNLGWAETKDASMANMILCSYWKNIMKWIPTLIDPRFSHRRLVIWTQEPYHDFHKQQDANKVTINNVYTGTVFKDNYRYFRWGEKDLLSELTDANLSDAEFAVRKFPLLALSTKYPKTYWNPNKLTLLPRRYEVIEYGLKHPICTIDNASIHDSIADVKALALQSEEQKAKDPQNNPNLPQNIPKMCKVWGKGWPDGLAQGESRTALNREEEKRKILRTGLFNVAIENTDTPFYVSEKIWESIESYCLPIYWPNATIYQDFPVDSFIDAKAFYDKWGAQHWVDKLYKYIQQMTKQEYIERLNRCIRTFNLLCTKGLAKNLRTDAQNRDLHLIDYSRNWEDFKKIFV